MKELVLLSEDAAQNMLLCGKIDGFASGQLIQAKRGGKIRNDKTKDYCWFRKGSIFFADKFAKGNYGVTMFTQEWTVRRSDFEPVSKMMATSAWKNETQFDAENLVLP